MEFNIIQVISIIAIFQALFLSVYFLTVKKGERILNRILSVFLLCFAVLMTTSLWETHGIVFSLPQIHKPVFLIRQIGLFTGPLMFCFVKRFVNVDFRLKRNELFHLIPFGLSLVYFGYKLFHLQQFIIWQSNLNIQSNILILLHNLVYLFISLNILRQKRFDFKSIFKLSGNSGHSGILMLISGTIIIWTIQLNSLVFLNILKFYKYCPYMSSLYSACTFLFFNLIAYSVLYKPEYFTRFRKYEKSSLMHSEKNLYQKKLTEHMEREKPYLNPSLSLTDLALAISISSRELSQVLNETFNQHFYDFLNHYRIKESMGLLKHSSNGHKTILEVAYSVGFNSKSAFNTAFKKHTGSTPSEFRRKNNGKSENLSKSSHDIV